MKVNILDAHDRYLYLQKQEFSIGDCCQDLINKRPFGNHQFYIFAHPRTEDNEPGVKRMIWQPRLTKPKAQANSMLFKGYPGTDLVKIIWMIPDRHLWSQFASGNVTDSAIVRESIQKFQYNRTELEQNELDDLTDSEIAAIYTEISRNAKAT